MHTQEEIRIAAEAALALAGGRRVTRDPGWLLDSIPQLSPGWLRPHHLEGYAAALERALLEPGAKLRVCGTIPPRHAKTETIIHAFAGALLRDPSRKLGYATYSADLAESKSVRARTLALRAGVKLGGGSLNRMSEWRTAEGGGLLAAGVRGSWTGHGVDVLVIDDPIKDREEAESPTMRRKVLDWYNDVADSRLEPGGSIIINMTRWHEADLVGSMLREGGWDLYRHPAILDEGTENERPLWPERWPLEELQAKRERLPSYSWASLYKNEPTSRGGTLFHAPQWCDELPTSGYGIGRGVDLAYSMSTRGDSCAFVELWAMKQPDGGTVLYVADVMVARAPAEAFAPMVVRRMSGGRSPLFRTGGQEQAVARLLERLGGLKLDTQKTVGDKWTNALDLAGDWNGGRVLFARNAPWVRDNGQVFVDEVIEQFTGFTGLDGEPDDVVDAMVSAQKQALTEAPSAPRGLGNANKLFVKRRG